MSTPTSLRHQMWCDVSDRPVRAGDMRADTDSQEIRTTTDIPCAYCGSYLVRFSGYRERVLITALVGTPVDGHQLVDIADIPRHIDILGCDSCRCNFTSRAADNDERPVTAVNSDGPERATRASL